MTEVLYNPKIKPEHLARKAIVYLRQSSDKQVRQNKESQLLQYAMAERVRALGWQEVEIINSDLGSSAGLAAAQREGFERVLSSVALGEVGIVGSREVSRLSRTDKDWCRLLEVCQIFGTLIADEQQVYDLNNLDDQLVLGIKGTLSVVELKVMRQRMLAGQEAKARRGELFKRLPIGYARDPMGKIMFHPDRRVCEAIQLVFAKFRELWSVRQTFQWFRDHDLELPVNPIQGTRLIWKVPSQSLIRDILHNPFYAGAYVWGRRPVTTLLVGGRLEKRQSAMHPAEECRVFIRDHHVGYIDWATYEENQRMIRRNSVNWEGDESMAAIRAGQGLLVGLLRCGHCGRKLHVRYWGGRGTHARYLCKGDFNVPPCPASSSNWCMRRGRPSNSTTRWMPGIDLQPASWNGGGTESWKRSRQSSSGFPVSKPSAIRYRLKRKSEYVRWAITLLESGRATTVPRHLRR